jgi:SnoaL-like domain
MTGPDKGLEESNRDLVERFFEASEHGDFAALESMIDDEMVMDWPRSGERFRGRAAVLGAMSAVEVKPEFAGQPRLVGSGQLWVLMVPLRYGEDILQYVAVLELDGGRVRRATGYWGAPVPGGGVAGTIRRPRVNSGARPDTSAWGDAQRSQDPATPSWRRRGGRIHAP